LLPPGLWWPAGITHKSTKVQHTCCKFGQPWDVRAASVVANFGGWPSQWFQLRAKLVQWNLQELCWAPHVRNCVERQM
jgi:hypothetical protein